jgi:hypothetical protein
MGPYGSAVEEYAAAGIPTFPLGGDDGKRPLVRRPMKFGTAASVKLADRHAAANIGFWCGQRSGLTIADIDTQDERELDWTLKTFGNSPIIVRTGSGKYHVWYRHNGERRRIKPFEGHSIDLLGSNGLCVAPPSIRPGGGAYAFMRGRLEDARCLPAIRASALLALGDATPAFLSDRGECAATGGHPAGAIGSGHRNNALFKIGLQSARKCVTDAELHRLLKAENDRLCVPPLEAREVERTVSSVWRLKVEGRLWIGSSQKLVLDSEQISSFIRKGESDGLMLFLKTKQAHGGQRLDFALSPKAMARDRVLGAWSPRRYRNAIETNLALGTMERTHVGGRRKGDATQYRLSDPGPSKPIRMPK